MVPACHPGNRNLPHPTRVASYTNAQEDFRYILECIGENPDGFSQHSMKRGGASEAARNGASATDIQTAGNWASLRTARRYIDYVQPKNSGLRKFLS